MVTLGSSILQGFVTGLGCIRGVYRVIDDNASLEI